MNVLISLVLAVFIAQANAFWRLSCGRIQMGRVDPIINPNAISGHSHTISGPINFNTTSTFESLQAAYCTSCSIQSDKSAYWTPQLYYRYRNGSFIDVPNGGTVIYYLDRGDDNLNLKAFPPGYQVLSGDSAARSYNRNAMTYGGNATNPVRNRPIADRVSFACLDYDNPSPETPRLAKTNCPGGLRAQIHFPSCWDGKNLYKTDQSHVTYLSGIDLGVCPPTHPVGFPHLFFEVIYSVNNVKPEKGGYFVFANGDTTGYGFHGDFLNGWDPAVLDDAILQCMGRGRAINDGSIEKCPPLNATFDSFVTKNCPEQPPIVKEKVKGLLKSLPGCNPPTGGPLRAAQAICPVQPNLLPQDNLDNYVRKLPIVGDLVNDWEYIGCGFDQGSPKMLQGASYQADSNMTIDNCQQYCTANSYAYSGLSNGYQCYCGNALVNTLQSQAVCSTQAHIVCNGNNLQYCGGRDVVHVYKDKKSPIQLKGVPVAGQTKLSLPFGGQASYAGCYPEPDSGRAMVGGTSFSNDTGMTNELCSTFCNQGKFNLFGTEYGRECYCGNSISTAPVGQKECIFVCKGDNTQFCGAGKRMSLWSIDGNIPSTPPPTTPPGGGTTGDDGLVIVPADNAQYLKCVSETTSGPRALSAFFKNDDKLMSIDYCAALAKQKNYALFGLEYGSQCLLGDTLGATSQDLTTTRCNVKCKAANAFCGGPSAISLYNNTAYTPRVVRSTTVNNPNGTPVVFKYQGCYPDSSGARTLGQLQTGGSTSVELATTNSVDTCAAYCYGKGFTWAGVEFGRQCYCNNAGIINNKQQTANGDADCNMPCTGNVTQNCGQSGTIQVYQLALSQRDLGSEAPVKTIERRRRHHLVSW